ncbi:hypothetical protein V8C34DRAFT_142702 [Trichoderma compactum]
MNPPAHLKALVPVSQGLRASCTKRKKKGHALRFCKRKIRGGFLSFYMQYEYMCGGKVGSSEMEINHRLILIHCNCTRKKAGVLKKRDGISSHIRRTSKRLRSPSCTAWSFASPAMEKTACQRNTKDQRLIAQAEEPTQNKKRKKSSVWGGRNQRGRPGIMHGVQSAKPRNQPWEIPTLKGHHNLFCLPACLRSKSSGRRGAGFPRDDDSRRLSLPPRCVESCQRRLCTTSNISTTLRCQFQPPGRMRNPSH